MSFAVMLIAAAASVGWMFHASSVVRFVLPDTAAAAANTFPAQSKTLSPAQQLRVWLRQAAPSLDALLALRDRIDSAAVRLDDAEIRGACEAGRAVLPRVQERLPSPDVSVNAVLQRAVDGYRLGFAECLSGTRHQDAAGEELAAVHLYRASDDLRMAMAVIARDLAGGAGSDAGVVTI